MSQLILPHSIDAGTAAVANEVQQNFTTTRDIINGQLEGGPGSAGNIKADGITARELQHNLMKYYAKGPIRQEGIFAEADFKVTPSANLTLAVAAGEAMIKEDTPVVFDQGTLTPVKMAAGTTITLDTAHGTLPRVDLIVAKLVDYETVTIEKVTGTPTAGAQVNAPNSANYRAGAGAVGNDRILLADVIVPATDTVISADQIIDRRPWASGSMTFDVTTNGFVVFSDLDSSVDRAYEVEFSGKLEDSANFAGDINVFVFGRINEDSAASTYNNYNRRLAQNGGTGTHNDLLLNNSSTGFLAAQYVGFNGTQDYELTFNLRIYHHAVQPTLEILQRNRADRGNVGHASNTSTYVEGSAGYFGTNAMKSISFAPNSAGVMSGKLRVTKLWIP